MPVLVTERLILRPPEAADLEGWAEVMGDPETSRHIGGPLSRGGAWRSLAVMAGSWALYRFGNFSVLDKGPGSGLGGSDPGIRNLDLGLRSDGFFGAPPGAMALPPRLQLRRRTGLLRRLAGRTWCMSSIPKMTLP